jgi:hypothetical protein
MATNKAGKALLISQLKAVRVLKALAAIAARTDRIKIPRSS